jgi:hypothetical protein
MSVLWAPDLDALLIENYNTGLSFRQIAVAINAATKICLSRNACIGRATRLHLPPRPTNPPHSRKAPRPERRLSLKRQFAARKSKTLLEGFLCVSFEELKDGMCRFPDDSAPALYCGQPQQEDSPYCPRCHRIAYLPRKV